MKHILKATAAISALVFTGIATPSEARTLDPNVAEDALEISKALAMRRFSRSACRLSLVRQYLWPFSRTTGQVDIQRRRYEHPSLCRG